MRPSAARTTLMMSDSRLPFDDPPRGSPEPSGTAALLAPALPPDLSDSAARTAAVDPSQNVVLEASAGTGKTRVLVERYVNLLLAGVDPDNILAITFTRKAAAEMRRRIVQRIKEASRTTEVDRAKWRDLRGRLSDIAISTIDAFCLSLLREFPLEADVDPGFDLADATEVSRLTEEALDQALRICRARAREDDDIALVFVQLGERRLRDGLTALLGRRLVVPGVLRRFLEQGPGDLTAARACAAAASRLHGIFNDVDEGLECFLDDGPVAHPHFAMLAADIRRICGEGAVPLYTTRAEQAAFRVLLDRLRAYFLTQQGEPRKAGFAGSGFSAHHCASLVGWEEAPRARGRHRARGGRCCWCVPPRSQRRAVARRVAHVRRCADHVRADPRGSRPPRFFRCPPAGDRPPQADGRVRAQPVPARSAISPRAGR